MATLTERFILAYHFFLDKEQKREAFTLDDLAKMTNWSMASVKTYRSKKWGDFLIKQGNHYLVRNVSTYTEEQFVRMMSQNDRLSNQPFRPPISLEAERLIIKAREAAMHALDSYNRPATIFRTEGYLVMMVIAWRTLYHAIFEKRGTKYVYEDSQGRPTIIDGDEKTWDLSKCAKVFFGQSTNSISKNLEFVIGLRNKIEHRYVPALDPHVAGECQALLLNFDNLLVEEFGDFYAIRESLAVPLQTVFLRSAAQMDVIKKFQGEQYDDLKDYIDTFRDGLSNAIYDDPKYSFRVYLIPKVGNRQSSSDIAFEFVPYDASNPEEMAALQKQVTLIKERQVPVANAGAMKPSQVARAVSDKIGRPFMIHHHTMAWKRYKVRQSGETPEGCNIKYCQFDQAHGDYVYTPAWVDFLVTKLSNAAEYEAVTNYKDR